MTRAGVAGEHDELRRILRHFGRGKVGDPLTQFNDGLAVRDAGRGAEHDRCVVFLGKFEGELGELQALLRVARLQHRDLGGFGVVAAVLFVLRGMQFGVVCTDENQAPVDAGVGEREERVGSDVDADVLHGHQGPRADERRAYADLKGYLLISGPGRVDLLVADGVFQYLGGRGAGIGTGDFDPCLVGAPGNGFVAGKNFLHVVWLPHGVN